MYMFICIRIYVYVYDVYIYIYYIYIYINIYVKMRILCIISLSHVWSMHLYVSLCMSAYMCMHIHRMHVKLQKTYKYVNVCVDLQHLWGHASNTSGSQKSSEAVDGHCSVWLAKRGVEPYKPPCLQCVTAWNLLIWLEELVWSRQTFSERMVLYSFEFPFTWQWRE